MGYDRHHAIVITGFDSDRVAAAYDVCVSAGATVSKIVDSPLNSWCTFAVCPDGSKEGWPDSDEGDHQRRIIVEYLRSLRTEDGSTWLDWVEIQYGDDERETKIVAHSDEEQC